MTYFGGIDIGSLSTDTVIIDHDRTLMSWDVSPTGASSKAAAEKSFAQALARAKITPEELAYVVATGYGRISVPFSNKTVTEITCHGRGAYHLFPGTRTIIDIGGQDSKVIRIDDGGKVVDFAMNDKCAAGTGRFLEVMARALEVPLEEMGALSFKATQQISISSMCTVFAESEVISLVAQALPKEDIINGIHTAICNRIFAMMDRVGVEPEITMTGGVAKNVAVVDKVGQRANVRINVPPEPQIAGALGAALIARDLALKIS